MKTHKHHNPPRHRVGDHDNVVEVTPTCHAMFHYCEWRLWGSEYDKIAWKCLSGQISGKEISQELEKERVKKCVAFHTGRKRSAETRRRISESRKGQPSPKKGIPLSEAQKKKMSETAKKRRGKTEEEKKAVQKAWRQKNKARRNELERKRYWERKQNLNT